MLEPIFGGMILPRTRQLHTHTHTHTHTVHTHTPHTHIRHTHTISNREASVCATATTHSIQTVLEKIGWFIGSLTD
jgi:phosphoribosyl-dephospho-CoA transferase